MEALAAFLGRISSYNLLNNLIPGAIFCVIMKMLAGYDFMNVDIIELLVLCLLNLFLKRLSSFLNATTNRLFIQSKKTKRYLLLANQIIYIAR